MKKNDSIDETTFWSLVEAANWKSDHNYDRIKIGLIRQLTPSAIDQFQDLFQKFNNKLAKAVDNYCDQNNKTTGCSDDPYSDLIAHVVGLGKEEYEQSLKNPELVVARAKKGDYKESFSYSIPSKEDLQYMPKSYYMEKARQYLEDENLAAAIKLPERKKEAMSVLHDMDFVKELNVIVNGLNQVAAGNVEYLAVQGVQDKSGYDSVESHELYSAWKKLSGILGLHYGPPNLIKDYNRYKEFIS